MHHLLHPTNKTTQCALMLSIGLIAMASQAWCLKDGQALTPPMGWNSYNKFGVNVTESQVKEIADAFVTSGLKDAGYQYIVIDDMWAVNEGANKNQGRETNGDFKVDTKKFPGGMKALGDYIHSKGLKFGLYSNPTTQSCSGQDGSFEHEEHDAQVFASWGVDYLKYDWCGSQSGENAKNYPAAQLIARYVKMRDALKATGRPIVYAICDKGQGVKGINISIWSDTVGHMWRIGNDINASWDRIWAQVDNNVDRAQYAHPGGWNDPDMMEAGNGSLTEAENRAHMSLWCIMASPMHLGNDVRSMSASLKAILTNKEATAINQDSLGKQGTKLRTNGGVETWIKDLKNGDKAVLFVNRNTGSGTATLQWTDLKWTATTKVNIRDIWKKTDTKDVTTSTTVTVPGHDAVMYRLTDGQPVNITHRQNHYFAGMVFSGKAQALSLSLPDAEGLSTATVNDIGGREVARFPIQRGENRFPVALNAEHLYTVRISGPRGIYSQLLFPSR